MPIFYFHSPLYDTSCTLLRKLKNPPNFLNFFMSVNRLWRNEVEHKKKERLLLNAAELKESQKRHLLEVRFNLI